MHLQSLGLFPGQQATAAADGLPWKLACSGSQPAAATAPLATTPGATATAVASTNPGGAAAGAVLLQLVKAGREAVAAASATKDGAEAGAALLQQLKGGPRNTPKGDAAAGAALLRCLQQRPERLPWRRRHGEGDGADWDGIAEAHEHTDGNAYVWVNGEWIKAATSDRKGWDEEAWDQAGWEEEDWKQEAWEEEADWGSQRRRKAWH